MDTILTILTAILTSSVVTTLVTSYIKTHEIEEQRRWEIKREACLDALEIIDSRFADYPWVSNGVPLKVDKQDTVSTAKIRSCFNKLVVVCENSNVPEAFENCLNLNLGYEEDNTKPLNMTEVMNLRTAIRKELGLKNEIRTKLAWIAYINWKTKKN